MPLIDTHCHLNMIIKKEFDVPLPNNFKEFAETVINNAHNADVETLINVGTSLQESKNCVELAKTFGNCFATLGIHPNDLDSNWKMQLQEFEKLLEQKEENKIVGIGEIGLDFYRPGFDKELQYSGFKAQIELALDFDFPIVIHTRAAGQSVLDVLQEYQQEKLRGIIHCFSEDRAFAERAIDLGFVLGIGGPLTYPKNDILRQVFTTVPLEKIVLETDAPFLPPQNMRGHRNEPAHLLTVAELLAELRGIAYQEVADITTKTAKKLFKI